MKWSTYQNDIFENLTKTQYNINILATAGSGKSTTLIESLNRIPAHRDSIFLSFSNTIVNELKERVPSYVQATTLHSLGYGMVAKMFKNAKFKQNKYVDLALNMTKRKFSKELFIESYGIEAICNYIRSTLTPLVMDDIAKMCLYYGLNFTEEMIEKSIELIERHSNLKKINHFDFADMIYLPATRPELIPQCYDYVFLDEAQDCNAAQMQFVEGLIKLKGRLISVGDKNQSIYGFSGTRIDAFQSFSERPNTITLPLSVSYRCAKKIVENAQLVYDDIQYAEGAIEGSVRAGNYGDIREGDMILCRNNAPLISLYFHLIEREIKASIKGKDIEKGIIELAQSVMSHDEERFVDKLEAKLQKLDFELRAKGVSKPAKHPKYVALYEKIEIILIVLGKVEISMLIDKIKEIFLETKEGAILMSIHKSKGLERDRVFYIERYNGKKLIPSQFAVKEWELVQEDNLLFVCLTRAKKELIYIDLED